MKKAKNHKKNWSIEEDDYLESKWGKMAVDRIAKRLGRSIRAVEHRAVELSLGGMYSTGDYWMASEVARIIGVARSTVCNWIKKYDLKAKKVCYKDQPKYQIDLKDLIKWLEENQDKWSAKKLDEYGLGVEPEWLREKRRIDISKKDRREPYTEEEDFRIVSLYKLNYTFEQIAKETNRSIHMVKNRIKVLRKEGKYNIPYKNGRNQINSLKKAV